MLKADVIKTTSTDASGKTVTTKTLKNKSISGNRISSNFLYRFVVQQNQMLLGNGVTLKNDELKKELGRGFDTRLQETGEDALLHGVSWGFWNLDHVEFISSVKDQYSGFVALCDEMTSQPKVGIQFWQIASNKPMGVRLFEMDGVTVLRYKGTGETDGDVHADIVEAKRAYKIKVLKDGNGSQVIDQANYPVLPVVPLYANKEKRSEFTSNIKSKIDMYDRIFSDFGDNLERANDVYWVLNNFGGTTDDIVEMIDQMNRIKAVVNQSNAVGGGATAEPRTIEVPYVARATALDLLRKALYQDYMALDMDEIRGGSLTNVAIQTATANLNLKVDRYEWKCFDFVQSFLMLIGAPEDSLEQISFVRRNVNNDSETIDNIYKSREDVTLEWALKHNPMVNPDEVDEIVAQKEKEKADEEAKQEEERKRLEEAKSQEATVAIKNATKGANGEDGLQQNGSVQTPETQEANQEKGQVKPEKSE